MSFLIIPAMLLWGLSRQRWRLVGSFVAAMGLLLGISFLWLPGWLAGFLSQVNAYPGYTITGSPIWVLTGFYFPQLGRPVEVGLSILALLLLAVQWRRLSRVTAVADEFLLITGLTLVVTNLIVVRTATTNYVMMYVPLIWGLKRLSERFPRGNLWAALFFLVSSIGSWMLFLATIEGNQEHPINYLPLPFLLLILLWWAGRLRLKIR